MTRWRQLCDEAKFTLNFPDQTFSWDIIGKQLKDKKAIPPLSIWVHPCVAYDLYNDLAYQPWPIMEHLKGERPYEETGLEDDTYESLLMAGLEPHTVFITKSSIGSSK